MPNSANDNESVKSIQWPFHFRNFIFSEICQKIFYFVDGYYQIPLNCMTIFRKLPPKAWATNKTNNMAIIHRRDGFC